MLERPTPDQQQDYERQARLQYDPNQVNDSIARWNAYSDAEREAILAEGDAIYAAIAAQMEAGRDATDPAVQAILDRWQQHLHHFYEPNLEILRGLGDMYVTDKRFRKNFARIHLGLPDFLRAAIAHYVDVLETAELERMEAEDDARRKRLGM